MLDKIRKAEPNAELDEALSQLTPDELKMIAGGDGEKLRASLCLPILR